MKIRQNQLSTITRRLLFSSSLALSGAVLATTADQQRDAETVSVPVVEFVAVWSFTPEQPVAHFLAYMESIIGIFYTTVLVASLIGVRLADDPAAT